MAGGRQAYEWWPKTVNQAGHKSFGPPDEPAHDLSKWQCCHFLKNLIDKRMLKVINYWPRIGGNLHLARAKLIVNFSLRPGTVKIA